MSAEVELRDFRAGSREAPAERAKKLPHYSIIATALGEVYAEAGSHWNPGDLTLGLYYLKRHKDRVAKELSVELAHYKDEPVSSSVLQELQRWLRLTEGTYKKTKEGLCAYTGLSPYDVRYSNWTSTTMQPAFYVAVIPEDEVIVLALRGTKSVQDAITDITMAQDPFLGGMVHRGMLHAIEWYIENLVPDLKELADDNPSFEVVLLGHSLGGGVAALLTLALNNGYHLPYSLSCKCYVFAPPACVSLNLAESSANVVTSVVLGDDIIPRFSLASLEQLRRELQEYPWMREMIADAKALRVVKAADEAISKTKEYTMKKAEDTKTYTTEVSASVTGNVTKMNESLSKTKANLVATFDATNQLLATSWTKALAAPFGEGFMISGPASTHPPAGRHEDESTSDEREAAPPDLTTQKEEGTPGTSRAAEGWGEEALPPRTDTPQDDPAVSTERRRSAPVALDNHNADQEEQDEPAESPTTAEPASMNDLPELQEGGNMSATAERQDGRGRQDGGQASRAVSDQSSATDVPVPAQDAAATEKNIASGWNGMLSAASASRLLRPAWVFGKDASEEVVVTPPESEQNDSDDDEYVIVVDDDIPTEAIPGNQSCIVSPRLYPPGRVFHIKINGGHYNVVESHPRAFAEIVLSDFMLHNHKSDKYMNALEKIQAKRQHSVVARAVMHDLRTDLRAVARRGSTAIESAPRSARDVPGHGSISHESANAQAQDAPSQEAPNQESVGGPVSGQTPDGSDGVVGPAGGVGGESSDAPDALAGDASAGKAEFYRHLAEQHIIAQQEQNGSND